MIGKQLGHHRVLERIGAGGMGEVYVAEDTKLGRKVALKVLPPEMARDRERRSRFEREAKLIAALNHPNIVTIHSVEEDEGVHYLTMELVEGRTLSDLIPTGGLPLPRFLDLALPIADAVSAAHKQGITHRDLKPDNIMVSADGRVKVLDFGLAKHAGPPSGDDAATLVQDIPATQEGRILGTVNYMSPEQAQGRPVDSRSDVFSLGIIFYEMATGLRPFQGETGISILSSILKDTPRDLNELKRGTPRHLVRIIARALAKEPEDRHPSALELRAEIASVNSELQDEQQGTFAARMRARARRAPRPALSRAGLFRILGGVLIGAVLVVAGWRAFRPRPDAEPVAQATAREPTVAVIDFRNLVDPEDPTLGTIMTSLVQVGLIESSPCRVLSLEFLKDLRRRLFGSAWGPIAQEQALALAREGGTTTLLFGDVAEGPERILVTWRLVDAGTGEALGGRRVSGVDYATLADSTLAGVLPLLAGECAAPLPTEPAPVAQLTTASPEAFRHFAAAKLAYDEMRLEDARRELGTAVSLDSTFGLAHAEMAKVHVRLQDPPQALAAAERAWALRARLGVRDRLKLEMLRARLGGEQQTLLASSEEILARWPEDKDALTALSISKWRDGFLEDALGFSVRALGHYPDDRDIQTNHVYILAGLGRLDEALAAIRAHVERFPDNPNAWDSLGDIHLRRAEPDSAEAAFRKALALSPGFWASERNLVHTDYLRGELQAAIAACEQKLRAGGNPVWMTKMWAWWLGIYYQAAGRYADTDELYRGLLAGELDPLSAATLRHWRAIAQLYAGRPTEALMTLEELRDELEGNEDLRRGWTLTRGWVLTELGSLPAARSALAEVEANASERGPHSAARAQALDLAARLALAEGDAEFAASLAEQSLRIGAGALPPQWLSEVQIEAYRRLGRAKKALAAVRQWQRQAGGWARYHYLLGQLLEEQGETDQAAAAYERFLEMWAGADPDRPELADARARLAALGGGTP